jgi:hypothetical protein
MLDKLLGGGLVKTVGSIIDSVHTSEEEKNNAKIKLKEIEASLNQAQTQINLADSKSTATGIGGIMQRVMALLGMAGIRSFDKVKKVNSDK